MPRFYFKIDDEPDGDGIELPTLAIAKCEAIKLVGRTLRDEADTFWKSAQWGLTVADDKGLTLFHVEVIGTDAPSVRLMVPSLPISI